MSQVPSLEANESLDDGSETSMTTANASVANGAPVGGQPKVEDALLYLEHVKEVFADRPDVYDAFLDIMKDFKAHNIDTPGVIHRVRVLFRGHRDLIWGFNTFLPPGFKIEIDELDAMEAEDAAAAEREAAAAAAAEAGRKGKKKGKGGKGRGGKGRKRSASSGEEMGDVGEGGQPKNLDNALNYVNKIKQRFADSNPEVYTVFLEILQTYQRGARTIAEVYDEISELFATEPDLLEEFQTFLPESVAVSQARSRKRSRAVAESGGGAGGSGRGGGGGGGVGGRALKRAKAELAADDEIGFFNAVKRRMTPTAYSDFLKVLNLFSNQILSTAEVVKVVRSIFGSHRDLITWFESFVDYKEKGAKLRRVRSIANLDSDEYIDYSQLKRHGPSYRALPTSYVRPSCSGRDDMCSSVLNDTWVASAAADSDDFIFKSSQKNEYEERLFQCEEERYELDMVIEHNASAIRALEPLHATILEIQASGKPATFQLGPNNTLGVIQLRAIERIYGHRAKEVLAGLRKNPHVAIPIILKRLRQKDRDWRRIQREWNKVWNAVNADNYRKSLDYRGSEFKTSDRKALTPKSMVSSVKEKVQ